MIHFKDRLIDINNIRISDSINHIQIFGHREPSKEFLSLP